MSVVTGKKYPYPAEVNPNHDTASVERLDSYGNSGLAVVTYAGGLKVRVRVVGTFTYVGEAAPGTACLSRPPDRNASWPVSPCPPRTCRPPPF
jgi:hypothetical protein